MQCIIRMYNNALCEYNRGRIDSLKRETNVKMSMKAY